MRPIAEQERNQPDSLVEIENQVQQANDALEKSQEKLQLAEKKVASSLEYLNQQPHVIVSKKLVSDIDSKIQRPAYEFYQCIEDEIIEPFPCVNLEFDIIELDSIGWKTNRAVELINELINKVSNLAENPDILIGDYFSVFWFVRQIASTIRKKAYGQSSLVFDMLMMKSDELDVIADQMHYTLMETDVRDDVLQQLEEADKKWNKLKKSSVIHYIEKCG